MSSSTIRAPCRAPEHKHKAHAAAAVICRGTSRLERSKREKKRHLFTPGHVSVLIRGGLVQGCCLALMPTLQHLLNSPGPCQKMHAGCRLPNAAFRVCEKGNNTPSEEGRKVKEKKESKKVPQWNRLICLFSSFAPIQHNTLRARPYDAI